MAATYLEICDDKSPSTFGFSFEGGRAIMSFLCNYADLEDSMVDLLGTVERTGTPALKRSLPRAHPQFTWLFAESVSNGYGIKPTSLSDSDVFLEATPVEQFTTYEKYLVTVNFTARPYPVLSDDEIEIESLEYVDPYGTTQYKQYAPEWKRFTDWNYEPSLEIVEAQQGMFKLRGNTGTAPDGATAQGMPSIRLPKTMVKATWYYVPYAYVYSSASRLRSFLGRVNQFSWCGFAAGCLLYSAVGITRHTPPFPESDYTSTGYTSYSANKLCTVDLIFELTERPMATGVTPTAPASTNYIQAGHNLVPWFGDRQFYYVSTTDNTADTNNAKRYPIYFSEPFELLFSDPDT